MSSSSIFLSYRDVIFVGEGLKKIQAFAWRLWPLSKRDLYRGTVKENKFSHASTKSSWIVNKSKFQVNRYLMWYRNNRPKANRLFQILKHNGNTCIVMHYSKCLSLPSHVLVSSFNLNPEQHTSLPFLQKQKKKYVQMCPMTITIFSILNTKLFLPISSLNQIDDMMIVMSCPPQKNMHVVMNIENSLF